MKVHALSTYHAKFARASYWGAIDALRAELPALMAHDAAAHPDRDWCGTKRTPWLPDWIPIAGNIAPLCQCHDRSYDLNTLATVGAAQACLESGWGTSTLAVAADNVLGIKATGGHAQTITGNNRVFADVARCWAAWAYLVMRSSNYAFEREMWLTGSPNRWGIPPVHQFGLSFLSKYCPEDDYPAKAIALVTEIAPAIAGEQAWYRRQCDRRLRDAIKAEGGIITPHLAYWLVRLGGQKSFDFPAKFASR